MARQVASSTANDSPMSMRGKVIVRIELRTILSNCQLLIEELNFKPGGYLESMQVTFQGRCAKTPLSLCFVACVCLEGTLPSWAVKWTSGTPIWEARLVWGKPISPPETVAKGRPATSVRASISSPGRGHFSTQDLD